MLCDDMALQHFPPIAAIQANHIVSPYRLPHWHGRNRNFLVLVWPPKLTECSMYRCDEFGNLSGSDCVMLDITPDYFGREMCIDLLRA
jgi:hypothetical protein